MKVIELPSAERPRASVIIVVSSAGSLLRRCLKQLASSASGVPFETIVVLNGLASGEASRLGLGIGGARFEESEVDLGLAGGLNYGRTFARGEFLVSLHDDVEVQPGWLEALVETADRDRGAGAVGSLVLGSDGRVQAAGWELLRDGLTRSLWDGDPPEPHEIVEPRAVDYVHSPALDHAR